MIFPSCLGACALCKSKILTSDFIMKHFMQAGEIRLSFVGLHRPTVGSFANQ